MNRADTRFLRHSLDSARHATPSNSWGNHTWSAILTERTCLHPWERRITRNLCRGNLSSEIGPVAPLAPLIERQN